MHTGGDPSLDDPQWSGRRWNGSQAYSDTKLHDMSTSPPTEEVRKLIEKEKTFRGGAEQNPAPNPEEKKEQSP